MPFDNGVIGQGETILIGGRAYNGSNPDGGSPMRDSLWGRKAPDAKARLAGERPDPAAEKYMELSPIDRYAAVTRDTGGGDNSDPREKQGPGSIPTEPTSDPS